LPLAIEGFFKQIKQSSQLCDFLGNSANAVRWQVWTALLLYILTRFLCVMSSGAILSLGSSRCCERRSGEK
jgi:hypothetical protein